MKMWYTFTMEYYSAVKKNKIMNSTDKWMDLENIILNEVPRTQKRQSLQSLLLEAPSSKSSNVSIYPVVTAETKRVNQDHCQYKGE